MVTSESKFTNGSRGNCGEPSPVFVVCRHYDLGQGEHSQDYLIFRERWRVSVVVVREGFEDGVRSTPASGGLYV